MTVENHTHGDDGSVIVVEEASPEQLAADAAVAIAEIEASKEIALAEIYAGTTEQQLEADVVETAMEVEAEFNAKSEIEALRSELAMALEEIRASHEQSESVVVVAPTEGESFEEAVTPKSEPRRTSKQNAWW